MTEPPRKETISSRISGQLREQILKGTMEPGSKVNLDRLREEYDVSISPLREAVSRLVADGLVVFEDQRGYRVTPVSRENLSEITRLRGTLEVMALRESIARGDLEWESNVMGALYRLNRTPRDREDPASMDAWDAAHDAFHMTLISGCGMPLLINFCTTLYNMNHRYWRLYLDDNPVTRELKAEHEAIAMHAAARSAKEACEALRTHILKTDAALRARLDFIEESDQG